ncbi:family 43 glycosylhydrolase [Bacillus sp. JCM 19041]|uniref:glycoside hydrolase family 43 protein n=1 Tax=Bacillus sp. JCM 19041 TaxID=1460637 RepID=UPI0006D29F6F
MNLVYKNPIVEQRADPWVYKHTDGYYYFTGSVPEYDRIELRRAKTINELCNGEKKDVWHKHEEGPMSKFIWAPELHFIGGKWYIYFAAAETAKARNRMFVLETDADNPLEGSWTEKGRIETKWDSFALDATTFAHRGIRYLVWAQKDPDIAGNTNLYIAKMKNPWTLESQQVMLTKPEHGWETEGYLVNEGPAVIVRHGRVFIAYSASATDHRYCMGLLYASENANLLDARSWNKGESPVFATNEETRQYGPGHNSFTVSEDGSSDVLIYHARPYKEIEGDPLDDPNRHARAQLIDWKNGWPKFGVPVADVEPV